MEYCQYFCVHHLNRRKLINLLTKINSIVRMQTLRIHYSPTRYYYYVILQSCTRLQRVTVNKHQQQPKLSPHMKHEVTE